MNYNRILALATAVAFLALACSKSESNDDNGTVTPVITQGTWTVHYFKHNGIDKTSSLAGYTFTFNSNNSVTASKAGDNTAGTWSEIDDSGKRKLVITWVGGGIPAELLEMEDDWIVKSKSATLIELTDGADELHLHKQ